MPPARVSFVEAGSPADLAGISAGCTILSADGQDLSDIIDWRWAASDDVVDIEYLDTQGVVHNVEVVRSPGEEWGIEFQDALFDGTRQCKNACVFCFMRQLPDDARDSLRMRDDDYRLSFLQGTFVTFTNLRPEDEHRIVEQHLSPLRFSLHAVTPELRRDIMGAHAQAGIEAAERLLEAGIELHAQIVLMPGVNDGTELVKTLGWAYAHPGITHVGIVPVGYTKHQTSFGESFNSPQAAQGVLSAIEPFREKAMDERGHPWVHASDEFYRNAYPESLLEHLPPASDYGDYDMFEDGIGIVRSFVDDFEASNQLGQDAARDLRKAQASAYFVCGCAQKEFFTPLLERAGVDDCLVPLYVVNDYFGGNVDVTGLLCACDIAPAIKRASELSETESIFVIPEVVFNADGVTLDGMTAEDIAREAGCPVHVVSCQASGFFPQIAELASKLGVSHG